MLRKPAHGIGNEGHARVDHTPVQTYLRREPGLTDRCGVLRRGQRALTVCPGPGRLSVGSAEVRNHFLGHDLHVLAHHPVRHRAHVTASAQHYSRTEVVGELGQALDHGLGRADDDVALLEQLFVGELPVVLHVVLHLRAKHVRERLLARVARRKPVIRRNLEAVLEQPHQMRLRLAVRLLVGLGDVGGNRSGQLLRRRLVTTLLGRAAVHVVVGFGEPLRGEHHHERIAALGGPAHSLDRARTRQPDRWVRLLKRPRPRVHVGEVEMLPLPVEGSLLRPRLHDQVMCLPEALL